MPNATRRAVLAVGAVGAVAACTPWDDDQQTADPDAPVIAAATRELQSLRRSIDVVTSARPALRRSLAAPRRIATQQLAALGQTPDVSRHARYQGNEAKALRTVASAEAHAAGVLRELAIRARGGELARLLACASAGCTQQSATLRAAS